MISKLFSLALWMILAAAPALAQSRDAAADPLSGTWAGELIVGDRSSSITMELKFDGKSKVTGTFTGLPSPGDVKAGTFDPKTGALKLDLGKEGEPAVLLVFEGTVVKDKTTGTVTGEGTGELKLEKKKKG